MATPSTDEILQALSRVIDPEIRRPITELGMVQDVQVTGSQVTVTVLLTVAGCPMRDRITRDVTGAVEQVAGVEAVSVELGVMTDEQRKEMAAGLRGGAEREIPFAQPDSLTRVYAVASGKGGVGKSSVTVNLAVSLAAQGLQVGIVDADIYGHSIPRMLGVTARPTQVENMIMPPQAHGVKVISIGMFTSGNTPVVWRGPMLHRALQQFLADVWWGDLDVLLLDLPPGTGDAQLTIAQQAPLTGGVIVTTPQEVALSLAQLIPSAEILVVTTPQTASAEVAERAGTIALQTHQQVVGVIENMAAFPCPHCGDPIELFGSGGGQAVAEALTRTMGTDVPLLGQVPLDVRLREGGDDGRPLVLAEPDTEAAKQLATVAGHLASRSRGLVGRSLGLSPS